MHSIRTSCPIKTSDPSGGSNFLSVVSWRHFGILKEQRHHWLLKRGTTPASEHVVKGFRQQRRRQLADAVVARVPALRDSALGDDMEAVKAKLTNPDCETFGDGIAAQCYVEHTTIAEKPAELLVRFLDGKVISVSVTGMTQEDAYAAADALKIKYGQPDYVNEQRYTIVRPRSNRSAIFRVSFWKVTPEDDRLFVEPATYTDKSFTYAAVKLMNPTSPRFQ